jgi:hypothetical protein
LASVSCEDENEGQFFDALSCKTKRGRERGKRRKGGEKREKREEKRREEIISLTPFLHMNMIIIETTNDEHCLEINIDYTTAAATPRSDF